MKIEKINDKQIRCTLTKADLESRQIKLSELAYGSEKARALFREMLTQAFRDFGFEANNIPLMIEAIPSGADQLVLLVTKVSNPEELDGHFSQFSTDQGKAAGAGTDNSPKFSDTLSGADDVLKLLKSFAAKAGSETAREGGRKTGLKRRNETDLETGEGNNPGSGREKNPKTEQVSDEGTIKDTIKESGRDAGGEKDSLQNQGKNGITIGEELDKVFKPLAGGKLSNEELEQLIERTGKFLEEIEAIGDVDALSHFLGKEGGDEGPALPESAFEPVSGISADENRTAESFHPEKTTGLSKEEDMTGSVPAGQVQPPLHMHSDAKAKDGEYSRSRSNSGSRKQDVKNPAISRNANTLTEEEIYYYTRFYLFRDLESVVRVSKRIGKEYQGDNSLYKNTDDGAFYLLVRKMDTAPELFNRICNLLSEYSLPMDYTTGMEDFFKEHMKMIIPHNALQQLMEL